jgi:hypothetical protein
VVENRGEEPRGSIKCGSDCPLCFCTLHTNEITHTDALVQVDYVRIVDLDIRANKSDICAVKVVTIRSAPVELEPSTARWSRNSYGKR